MTIAHILVDKGSQEGKIRRFVIVARCQCDMELRWNLAACLSVTIAYKGDGPLLPAFSHALIKPGCRCWQANQSDHVCRETRELLNILLKFLSYDHLRTWEMILASSALRCACSNPSSTMITGPYGYRQKFCAAKFSVLG